MGKVKTVAVLGANGTMGRNVSAIFASFGKCNVYCVCRTIESAEECIDKACNSVKSVSIKENLIPCSYEQISEFIGECDLIFESVSENIEVKKNVYNQIINYVDENVIIATGTSGLSINEMAKILPEKLRNRYLGVHMFNPPYNMTLCEMIPSKYNSKEFIDDMKYYLSNVLYRSNVVVKDKPAFLANRIGFYSINMAFHYANKFKYSGGIDYIDSIIGGFTGRSMAPLLTADFVGLDVHKSIIDNIYENTNDYDLDVFSTPEYLNILLKENRLGRKVGEGLYKKEVLSESNVKYLVYDIETDKYRNQEKYNFQFSNQMINYLKEGNYKEAIKYLLMNESIEAKLCVEFLLKYIVYSLYISNEVAEDIDDVDIAMATGFNWIPPMALVDAFNLVTPINELIEERLDSNYLQKANFDELKNYIKQSKYDYRKFLKAR